MVRDSWSLCSCEQWHWFSRGSILSHWRTVLRSTIINHKDRKMRYIIQSFPSSSALRFKTPYAFVTKLCVNPQINCFHIWLWNLMWKWNSPDSLLSMVVLIFHRCAWNLPCSVSTWMICKLISNANTALPFTSLWMAYLNIGISEISPLLYYSWFHVLV